MSNVIFAINGEHKYYTNIKTYGLRCTTIGFKRIYGSRSSRRADMDMINLRCKSVSTAEIDQYFLGRRSWDCVIWRHSCSHLYINTILYRNTWSKHQIGDVFYWWWCASDCAIRATWVPRGMTSLRKAKVRNGMKTIFFTFDFHILH